jgi:hypothetical protein
MLFRDVELLCQAIMAGDERLPDYWGVVTLDINVTPVAMHPPFQLDATKYFSKLQEALLEPFRKEFWGLQRVTIGGTAPTALIESALRDFSRDKFADPDALIESWTAQKATGTQLFLQGNDGALKHWAGVTNEIDEAHKGDSWSRLVQQGGTSFVAKVAELYYTTNLNIAHIALKWVEQGDRDVLPGAQKATSCLKDSKKQGYWGDIAHSWKPSEAQETKETLRYAKYLRLQGVPEMIPFATAAIGHAAHTNPDNAAVLEEKRKIAEWKRLAGPVDECIFNNMMNGLNV